MDRNAIALAAVLTLSLAGIALLVRAWIRSWRARARARRAIRGERRAELLLESRGYAIESRQHPGALVLEVDGAPHESALRCDLIVTRGGRRFVAEVKTGALAPRLEHAPTRRQIVEYLLAFDADAVLLVDPERARIREIALRRAPRARAVSRWPWAALTATALLLVVAAWLARS